MTETLLLLLCYQRNCDLPKWTMEEISEVTSPQQKIKRNLTFYRAHSLISEYNQ